MSNNTAAGLLATPQLDLLLERSIPGFSVLSKFLSHWLSLDITSLAGTLFIVGAAWGPLRVGFSKIYWAIVRFFTATISIHPADKLAVDVMAYLAEVVMPRRGTRILSAKSDYVSPDIGSSSGMHYWEIPPITALERQLREDKEVPIDYLPSFGSIIFTFGWNVLVVRQFASDYGWSAGGIPDEFRKAPSGREHLIIMCLGRSVEPLKRFLQHCYEFTNHSRDKYVAVHAVRGGMQDTYESGRPWGRMVLRPARPISTVHFEEKDKASLIDDISRYLNPETRDFYMSRGIPYRRGYLLHGPPGTGKTSLSLALASLFQMDLYLLHLPSIQYDGDYQLNKLFMALPKRCVVLVEDVDALGLRRTAQVSTGTKGQTQEAMTRRKCTLSGLLNAIDGIASHEGRIILMTTNHPEKLDRALIRPGRVDFQVYLGHISQNSARMMFLRMYSKHNPRQASPVHAPNPNPNGDEAAKTAQAAPWERKDMAPMSDVELAAYAVKFSTEIPEETFTPAQVQGFLLKYRDSPEMAASSIKQWVPEEIRLMEEEKAAIAAAENKAEEKAKARSGGGGGGGDEGNEKERKKTGKRNQRAKARLERDAEKELARLEAIKKGDDDDDEEEEEEEEEDKKKKKSDTKTLVNGNKAVDGHKDSDEGNANERVALVQTPPEID